jgi:hypothetical protein
VARTKVKASDWVYRFADVTSFKNSIKASKYGNQAVMYSGIYADEE